LTSPLDALIRKPTGEHKVNDKLASKEDTMNNFTNKIAQSMYDALWAIANMQVQEHTNKGEVLALCMSIARIELEKCRMMSQEDSEGKN
jgi:hypothetical protein